MKIYVGGKYKGIANQPEREREREIERKKDR